MKTSRPFVLGAVVVVAIAAAAFRPPFVPGRSVRPLGLIGEGPSSAKSDTRQSAALFVGIRRFSHGRALQVPYAVDDAVDLAYFFSLDRRGRLVPPSRIVLAISGRPQKDDSRMRLEWLKQAGARVVEPTQSNIITMLEEQAALAGRDGILILSLATHGFVHDGIPYILASTSRFEYPETAIPTPRLFDIASRSAARRSLVLIDACRERISTGTRAGGPQLATAAPLLEKMARVEGQVVFYAAAAGGYAYDDDVSRNGVFTKAILDGLRCSATTTRNVVTVDHLRKHVEGQVLDWIRRHRDPEIETAIQVSIDGRAESMPLAMCPPPPERRIAAVEVDGSRIRAFDPSRVQLWERDVEETVVDHAIEDLDADGHQEVVVATPKRLVTLDWEGKLIWTADEAMTLRILVVGDLQGKATRQVLALWNDERSSTSRLVVHDGAGQRLAAYDHPTPLDRVAIYRPNKTYDPRIIAVGMAEIFLFNAKKLGSGKPAWRRPVPKTIEALEFVDYDRDGRKDIAIRTSNGRIHFTVKGQLLESRAVK
ncbi:MAG: caspase family protein [Thermoanaerobaculia bacterium]